RVLRNEAGASQACVGHKWQPGTRRRNIANPQFVGPARTAKLICRKRFTSLQGFPQGSHTPARRRHRTGPTNKNTAHTHLLRIRVALAPPKPKELVNA